MHHNHLLTLPLLALLSTTPLATAQSGMTTAPSSTPTASRSSAPVITMMWDNEPTGASQSGTGGMGGMGGMSTGAGAVMTMSNGEVMTGMNGMSGMLSTATGSAMAGMNMSGSAGVGRVEAVTGALGVGWVVVSVGAGIGFFVGLL